MLSKIRKTTRNRSRHQCCWNELPYVFITSNITVKPLKKSNVSNQSYMHTCRVEAQYLPGTNIQFASINNTGKFEEDWKPTLYPHTVALTHILLSTILFEHLDRQQAITTITLNFNVFSADLWCISNMLSTVSY